MDVDYTQLQTLTRLCQSSYRRVRIVGFMLILPHTLPLIKEEADCCRLWQLYAVALIVC